MSKRKAKSGFFGVTELSSKRFKTHIRINGKLTYPGTYNTAKEAAVAYDTAALEQKRPIAMFNFPEKLRSEYKPKKQTRTRTNLPKSTYHGVSRKTSKFYRAQIKLGGVNTHLGTFDEEKKAAIAYDRAVHKHGLQKKVNFPTMKHDLTQEPEKGRKRGRPRNTEKRKLEKAKLEKEKLEKGKNKKTSPPVAL